MTEQAEPAANPNAVLSIPERLENFKARRIQHPRLTSIRDQIEELVVCPGGCSIAIVGGPTGVGKTTFAQHLVNAFTQIYIGEMSEDSSLIPALRVEAPMPYHAAYSWKDLYIEVLKEFNEPGWNRKMSADTFISPNRMRSATGTSTSDFRREVEKTLKYRRTKVLIIDEAQHLQKHGSARAFSEHLEQLKSMANRTNVLIVLLGTYDLFHLPGLSGQVGRRSTVLHFSRYDKNNAEDWTAFVKIVDQLQKGMPLANRGYVLPHIDSIYEGCLGCIGTLKDWMQRALKVALDSDADILTYEHLAKAALPDNVLLRIAQEIKEGESIQGEANAKDKIKELLGVMPDASNLPQTTNRSTRVPFQRTPTRDKVGFQEAV